MAAQMQININTVVSPDTVKLPLRRMCGPRYRGE